jgi:hypothetical protein
MNDSTNPRYQYSATDNIPGKNKTPPRRELLNTFPRRRQSYISLMQRWSELQTLVLMLRNNKKGYHFRKTEIMQFFQSTRTRDSGERTHGCWELEESRSSVRRWRCGSEEAETIVSRERECAWSSWGLQSRPPNPNVPITFSLRSPWVAFVRKIQVYNHRGTLGVTVGSYLVQHMLVE